MERKSWLNTHSYRQTHIFAYNNNNKYKSKGFTLHTHIQTQTHVETETEQGKSTWKNVKKNCEKAEGNREKIAYVNVHRNVLPQHTHIHTHTFAWRSHTLIYNVRVQKIMKKRTNIQRRPFVVRAASHSLKRKISRWGRQCIGGRSVSQHTHTHTHTLK